MTASTIRRRLVLALAALAAMTALVPAAASARTATYGATALELDSKAAAALTSLGVTPGVIAPGSAKADGLNFPITNSFGSTLATGTVRHSGGISLTAGATRVELTNFWINLRSRSLSAQLGSARAAILDLDFRDARVSFGRGGVVRIGPVTAGLTQAAADTLNGAFGVTAFTKGLVLGKATVKYSLLPRY